MLFTKKIDFLASGSNYVDASLVMYGAPMDSTTSFRPGTRFGPQRVREIADGLEEYSPVLDRELSEVSFYDAGDVDLPFGNVSKALDKIGQATEQILRDAKFPLLVGGEHLVSAPAILAVARAYPDLVVLHFDAHADLRTHYLGECNSHATVMSQVVNAIGGDNVYQFGIRSGTRDEFRFARANTHFYPDSVLDPLLRVLPKLGNRPIYCTIDIDVIDPAYAPGTGTPEAGGISSREMLQVIHALKEKNTVAMDIVELSPLLDRADITALLVAKLVREAILSFGKGVVR